MVDPSSILSKDSIQSVEPDEKSGSDALSTVSGASRPWSRPAAIPPILSDRRAEHHRHHYEKMPSEGGDLIRGGFAITSASLAVLAFIGSWISGWAVLPSLLAIVTAPPGLFSHRRLLAMIGVFLGLLSFAMIIGRALMDASR